MYRYIVMRKKHRRTSQTRWSLAAGGNVDQLIVRKSNLPNLYFYQQKIKRMAVNLTFTIVTGKV